MHRIRVVSDTRIPSLHHSLIQIIKINMEKLIFFK